MLPDIAKGRVATGNTAPHNYPMPWQLGCVLSWQNIQYRSFLQWKYLSDFIYDKTLSYKVSDLSKRKKCKTVIDVLVTEL